MPAATFPMKRGTIPFAPPTDGLSEKTQDTAARRVLCFIRPKRIDAYQTYSRAYAKKTDLRHILKCLTGCKHSPAIIKPQTLRQFGAAQVVVIDGNLLLRWKIGKARCHLVHNVSVGGSRQSRRVVELFPCGGQPFAA